MNTYPYGGLDDDFWNARPLVGMVHLGPLPGSARYDGARTSLDAVIAQAQSDARALADGGASAIMVENFFDAPFAKDNVPPHTVAALTRAVLAVRAVVGDVPVGVNCLRNDARSALAIAHITGARFVRVNVYVGAAVTDQGIIEGVARTATLYRRELGANVAIWADVFVKHAAQLGDPAQTTLEDAAKDAALRGLADALIISGAATGAPTSPGDVARVRAVLPRVPVLIGSGFNVQTAASLLESGATGAIVGASLKRDIADIASPVDPARVRELRTAMEMGPGT